MANYTDKETVKAEVGYTKTDYDTLLTNKLIPAISQLIDRKCNRPDGFLAASTATARLYLGTNGEVLRIDENVQVTAVGVKANATDTTYAAWDADEYLVFGGDLSYPDFNHTPYTGLMAAAGSGKIFTGFLGGDDIAWESGRVGLGMSRYRDKSRARTPTVQVTARWGYADAVPPIIEQACVIECARLFKQAQSNFAETLVSETLGKLIMTARLHPTTIAMLEDGRLIRPAIG